MSVTALDAARPYLASLAQDLTDLGAIRSKPWAQAFANVPRHLFVPSWFEQETDDRGITVWRERHADDEEDLEAAYRDVTLVTALDPETAERVAPDAWTGIPTSSSTQPSLMAGMLEDLGVSDGHRVLEIGTGTGYNAALLCARLGSTAVHSMDIDHDLVFAARDRLFDAGYNPRLVTGDGTQGYPDACTFDRIIATCSVPSIPDAWVRQLRPGGVIVADLALGIEGGLVRLSCGADGLTRGFFTTNGGRFMPARSDARAYPAQVRPERAPATGSRPTQLTAAEIRTHYALRLVLAFHLPDAELVYYSDEEGLALQLQRPDGSWARVPLAGDNEGMVTFGGDEGLWQRAEEAWRWWTDVGRPAHDRFGYAREFDGSAYAWHLPGGARWQLPT
ncbi:methyltransferase domain-containing protein [Streptomyces cinerochromogenes]|uniref:methyltransferase domain-containing protein n=1 Tax=Streptomyces cinerochromogenes TaxID=66422 RepID=UPI00166FB8D2|nr:methyltransferase domain-containing protein [Streptomyces cinerochromogenes]GGS74000.1 protein-L-isoaspartate O-methyltransferase [Streptomyces cinerochromogenes]